MLLGNGNGSFTVGAAPTAASGVSPPAIVAADFNGDHKTDLEGNFTGTGQASLVLGNGDGTFQTDQTVDGGSSNIADINRDGRSDMLSIRQGDQYGTASFIVAKLGQADGSFTEVDAPLSSSTFPQILAIGDIHGDGKP